MRDDGPMSAPPEQRGPARPGGGATAGVSWPIKADQGPGAPRPDLLAGLITVIAGALGVGQLFLSWSSLVSGVGLHDATGGVTGWERFLAARTGASLSVGDFITAYSVVGTALVGAALILLGLAMFLLVQRRPVLQRGRCDRRGAVVARPRAPHVQPKRRRPVRPRRRRLVPVHRGRSDRHRRLGYGADPGLTG